LLIWRLGHPHTVWFCADGRDDETAGAVGLFERYLPAASDLDDDLPLRDLVNRIAQQTHAPVGADAGAGGATAPPALQFAFDHPSRTVTASPGLSVSIRNL